MCLCSVCGWDVNVVVQGCIVTNWLQEVTCLPTSKGRGATIDDLIIKKIKFKRFFFWLKYNRWPFFFPWSCFNYISLICDCIFVSYFEKTQSRVACLFFFTKHFIFSGKFTVGIQIAETWIDYFKYCKYLDMFVVSL